MTAQTLVSHQEDQQQQQNSNNTIAKSTTRMTTTMFQAVAAASKAAAAATAAANNNNVVTSKIKQLHVPGITFTSATANIDYKFDEHYKLMSKLSKGSFGIVYVTEHISTHEEYAVKVIERSELNDKERSSVEREVSILHDFRNVDQIVKLVDFYVSPDRFYVVQQYAQGGDVFERLAQRTSYTEKDARDLAIHLLQAIQVLHDRKLAHRDLKPENLLLREMFDDTTILVADFGFASYVPPEGLKTRCGTPAFVAPQILIPNCRYDERVDMWSVGCLLYMLIAGYPPFQDRNHRGLFRKIRGADFVFHDMYWKNVSKSAKQLIASLLTLDPKYRCTASAALQSSSWLQMDPELLKEHDLGASLGEIKRFHARRTLKSAIHAVIWTAKYKTKSADEILINNTNRVKSGWDFMTTNPTTSTANDGGGNLENAVMNDNFKNMLNDVPSSDDVDQQHLQEGQPHEQQLQDDTNANEPKYSRKRQIIDTSITSGEHIDFSLKSDSILLTRLRPSLTFQDMYVLRELLHCGQTAKVYECYHKKTKEIYAVKIIERTSNDGIDGNSGNGGGGGGNNSSDCKKSVVGRTLTETVLHEVALLDSLNHNNIMEIKDFFEDDDCFYLLMERMYGHDVFEQIMKRTKIDEYNAKILAKSLLQAVHHFHDNGIAHRDLKPQNLLLKIDNDFSSIKITDFGFACRVHTPQSLTTRCGTPSYVAPEVLKNIPYDQSSDMWSVGIILFLVLSGNPPFIDDNQSELFRKIRTADWKFKGEEWDDISYDAKNLIKKCLIANPIQRITAKEALQCKWLGGAGIASELLSDTSVGSRRGKSTMYNSPQQKVKSQAILSSVAVSITTPVVQPDNSNIGVVEGQPSVESTIHVRQQPPTNVIAPVTTNSPPVPTTSTTQQQQDILAGKVEVNKLNNHDLVPVELNPTETNDQQQKNIDYNNSNKVSNAYVSTNNKSYLPSEDPLLRRHDTGISVSAAGVSNGTPVETTTTTSVAAGFGITNPRASAQAQTFVALMQGTSKPPFVDSTIEQVDNAMVDYYYDNTLNSPAIVDPNRKKYVIPMSNQQQANIGPIQGGAIEQQQQKQPPQNTGMTISRRSHTHPDPRNEVTVPSPKHEGGSRSRDPDGLIAADSPIAPIRAPPLTTSDQQQQQQNTVTPKRRSKRRQSMNQAMERLEI